MLLPLTFLFPAQTGVLFLLAIWNAAVYAGSIPSILHQHPGHCSGCGDGYRGTSARPARPCAKGAARLDRGLDHRRDRGRRSLLFMSPPLASLSLLFGPAEMFCFALFGMATVISLSRARCCAG